MGRNVSVTGLDQAQVVIRRMGDRTSRRMREMARHEAREIHRLAVMNAPIDTGDLEKAIVLIERRGANGRLDQTVKIDLSKIDLSEHGDFDYPFFLHESDAWNLGPRSEVKNQNLTDPDARVGSRYMDRAAEARKPHIEKAADKIVAEETRFGRGHS